MERLFKGWTQIWLTEPQKNKASVNCQDLVRSYKAGKKETEFEHCLKNEVTH